jgi:polyisoprenoid-binding protein YceI
LNERTGRLLLGLLLAVSSCAKKNPKPVHTEPWLAHPPPSASAGADAAAAVTTRYVLTDQSLVRFELPTKLGKVQGKLTKVSGEIEVALGALGQSRGQVRVDLSSLTLDNADSADWLTRARSALDIADAGASPKLATFEITALDDVSPEVLEPVRASDAGAPGTRRARAVVEGNLLLNGFRVLKREPLEVEFGFASDPTVPTTLLIRSRAPLVISLETHEIHSREPTPSSAPRHHTGPLTSARDVRVSIELYGRKD